MFVANNTVADYTTPSARRSYQSITYMSRVKLCILHELKPFIQAPSERTGMTIKFSSVFTTCADVVKLSVNVEMSFCRVVMF